MSAAAPATVRLRSVGGKVKLFTAPIATLDLMFQGRVFSQHISCRQPDSHGIYTYEERAILQLDAGDELAVQANAPYTDEYLTELTGEDEDA